MGQLTGGDYNRNIRKRAIEAKRKKEVDEISRPPPEQDRHRRNQAGKSRNGVLFVNSVSMGLPFDKAPKFM